jgi:hypothetical protein
MEKFQLDQLDMLYAVENHFDDNTPAWTSNVPLAAAKTLLTQKIASIGAQHALQLLNTDGVTQGKNLTRKNLETQAFIIGSALCTYANAVGNADLYNRARYTKSDLERFRDAELLGITTNLSADTGAEIANLAPYGVLPANLITFNNLRNAYGNAMKNPTEAIGRRKKATEKIAELLPDALTFLNERMDNAIVSLQTTQSDFVEIYYNVRAINSSPTNTRSLTTLCIDAESNAPIEGVIIIIDNANIKRITSASGFNVFQNLPSGIGTLKAEHVNYRSTAVEYTIVDGITTELVVQMTKL